MVPSYEPSILSSDVPSMEPSVSQSDEPSFLPSCDRGISPTPAPGAIDFGTSGNYAILAKAGISTVPNSVITGNIAVSPIAGTAMTGFSSTSALDGSAATSDQVSGYLYGANYLLDTPAVLTQAVSDMQAAYTEAASRPNTDPSRINLDGGILAGQTLTPGVYSFTVVIDIQDDITFCGGPNDVFIMQTTGTLSISASYKSVLLDCGAKAENIFWQAAGAVTIATYSHMEGNILGFTSVTMMTESSLNGHLHAQTAVVLQMATITPPLLVRRLQAEGP